MNERETERSAQTDCCVQAGNWGTTLDTERPIWIIEETTGSLRPQNRGHADLKMVLYKVAGVSFHSVAEVQISKVTTPEKALAKLLSRGEVSAGTLVSSHRVMPVKHLLEHFSKKSGCDFVIAIDPNMPLRFSKPRSGLSAKTARQRIAVAKWKRGTAGWPYLGKNHFVADLGTVAAQGREGLACFALSVGRIDSYQRGVLTGISSTSTDSGLNRLTQVLAWTTAVRLLVRRNAREGRAQPERLRTSTVDGAVASLRARPNRNLSERADKRAALDVMVSVSDKQVFNFELTRGKKVLNVLELFAGAGGMGLGFLSAQTDGDSGYRIIASAEINPIYVATLNRNHEYIQKLAFPSRISTPDSSVAMDLCQSSVRHALRDISTKNEGVDILIGGPPCQGFSNANRNSWSSSNPNNKLVDAFLETVATVKPKVLLMENVQGILWTPRNDKVSELSVAEHVLKRLRKLGYDAYPKLLDAMWYGVPQSRNRFFLLGIHRELGYKASDFGDWGPFPRPTHGPGTTKPFETVASAIEDLPVLSNGASNDLLVYKERLPFKNEYLAYLRAGSPKGIIWDHVTSTHSEYVLQRYEAIPPGGNWEDVKGLMTNYADVGRTHSNIYRRLRWEESAITIGHYRKSMIIHPEQHRGLSLREAARLQSFPDWFRFAGSPSGQPGGLMHKQQQLANAVCPLVTKAVAEFLIKL